MYLCVCARLGIVHTATVTPSSSHHEIYLSALQPSSGTHPFLAHMLPGETPSAVKEGAVAHPQPLLESQLLKKQLSKQPARPAHVSNPAPGLCCQQRHSQAKLCTAAVSSRSQRGPSVPRPVAARRPPISVPLLPSGASDVSSVTQTHTLTWNSIILAQGWHSFLGPGWQSKQCGQRHRALSSSAELPVWEREHLLCYPRTHGSCLSVLIKSIESDVSHRP